MFNKCVARGPLYVFLILLATSRSEMGWTQPRQLQFLSIAPQEKTAGAKGGYTIAFTAPSGLNRNAKILIQFPEGGAFDISGARHASSILNLNGGYEVTNDPANRIVGIERDGYGVDLPPNGRGAIILFDIINPLRPALLPYNFYVVTQANDGTPLDAGYATVTIMPDTLYRFLIAPINPSQRAGVAIPITVLAQDAFGNTISSFNNTVNLSSPNGEVLPKIVALTNGRFSGNVFYQTTGPNKTITVTDGRGHFGFSNNFNVDLGPLSYIQLRTEGNNRGVAFGDHAMTTDDSVTIFAAGYDVSNNYFGDVPVNWAQIGTLVLFPAPTLSAKYTFSPRVGSPATFGKIIGRHPTLNVRSDTTGTIGVTAGQAFGNVTLTAAPPALPANGKATAQVTSGIIKDRDNNPVGANRHFNLFNATNPSLGSVPLTVGTDSASILRFTFTAGMTGGAAKIFATSNNGLATGNVTISVNQLRILGVEAARSTVSQGQPNVLVTMTVQNVGIEDVSVDSAKLLFSRPADFTATALFPRLSILGNAAPQTLTFSVRVHAAAKPGAVTIDGKIFGKLPGGALINDLDADMPATWVVQSPPSLSYVSNPGLLPREVLPGNLYQFQLPIQNAGAATLELKPDSTIFSFADPTGDLFAARLESVGGSRIPGNGITTLTFRREMIPNSIQRVSYAPAIRLVGTHNGVRLDTLIVLPRVLTVNEALPLQISNILSSQDNVTQGMKKSWTLTLEVKNNTAAPLNLRNTKLSFVKIGVGADLSFQIVHPTVFKNARSRRLEAFSQDSLEFQIAKTGQSIGTLAVFAEVGVNELAEPALSNGTQKIIIVQTPVQLQVALRTSQPAVTQNQTQPWQVFLRVKNTGESAGRVIFTAPPGSSTGISLINAPGFIVAPPTTNMMLAGEDSADIVFNVTQTGPEAGRRFIDGEVHVQENNSGNFYFKSNEAAGRAAIVVQTAATVKIDSTTVIGGRNGAVSAGQKFQIRVRLDQTGEETVDSVRVRLLQKNGANSRIARDRQTLSSPMLPAIFDLIAGAAAADTFLARIEAAFSRNTRAATVNVGESVPQRDEIAVRIQKPAGLSILEVTTSEKTVRGGRTLPWFISVVVKNTGEAPLALERPQLLFKIGEARQNEYTLVDSTRNDGVVLAGGEQQTLIYKVIRTGAIGGVVTIVVTASGHDLNSNAAVQAPPQTTTFIVKTTALSRILKTDFPARVNRVADSDIALVNTGQIFPIEVTVENIGEEVVAAAYVSLVTAGNSIIMNQQAKSVQIDPGGGKSNALFSVQADRQPNRTFGETFTARLDSAVNVYGARVDFSTAVDSLATIRIEEPARLLLEATLDDNDNTLTIGQDFKLRVRAINFGEARTDSSGILQIRLPNGYRLSENERGEKNFAAGDFVVWSLQAPRTERWRDTLFVAIKQPPRDKNSGHRALVADSAKFIVMNTLATAFKIDSTFVLEPAGARDRIVSTGQLFTVAARITATSNLSDKKATLLLPHAGYLLAAGESATKQVSSSSVVSWKVQAPDVAHSSPVQLLVEAQGSDGQKTETRRDTLVIKSAQTRPILDLVPQIQGIGAEQGSVSVDQRFTLLLNLQKSGEAFLMDTAEVAIDISQTRFRLVESPDMAVNKKFVLFHPNAFSATVSWPVQAAGQPTPPGQQESVVFRLTKKPRDVNSEKEVQTTKDEAFFYLRIVDRGWVDAEHLQITNPAGARDLILSTEQEFWVSDSVYWKDAKDVRAQLLLPPGFRHLDNNEVMLLSGASTSGFNKPSWRVRAPGQKVSTAELKILVQARDARNDTSMLTPISHSLHVSVVQRAVPRLNAYISNPANARDRKVSVGQPFEVAVEIQNAGEAQFYGPATVSVDFGKGGYTLANPLDSQRQTSRQYTSIWRIRARPDFSDEPDAITFHLETAPRDTNTNEEAINTFSQAVLVMRTEAKKLLVEPVGGSGGPAVRGQKDLALLHLKLGNWGDTSSSALSLRKLQFKLQDREQRTLSPATALAGIRVVNANRRQLVYGALTPVSSSGPLQIAFAEEMTLAPDRPDTILILGEIAEMATARNFRLVFEHERDFEVVDGNSGLRVTVENKDGQSGGDFRLVSNLTVLSGAAPQEAFFNYPNPFQPGNEWARNEGTYFNYNLPAASDGRLQIFTLLGELVWETSFSAADPAGQAGNHPQDIFWNGHNGAGRRVLNGVYIAILRLPQYGKLTTKVAVLKK